MTSENHNEVRNVTIERTQLSPYYIQNIPFKVQSQYSQLYYTLKGIIWINFLFLYPKRYNMTLLSKTIKAKRKENGLTQEDLSLKSGLGLRLIREIEQGKTSMRMDKVNQLLNLFGMELVPAPKSRNHE